MEKAAALGAEALSGGGMTAFERACDLSRPWCAALLAEVGGPWQALGMGRRRFLAAARRAGAPEGRAEALWSACGGPRPCESLVRAEAE